MRKILTVLLALMLALVSAAAVAEHDFHAFIAEDGTVYDLFVINKLNYGGDHIVTSVTGRFERILQTPDSGEEPETAAESEMTFTLASDFRALLCEEPNVMDSLMEVTDLYQWYVDTHLGGEEELEGRELVFRCDLPDEEKIDGNWDFDMVITMIELNEQNEIVYMESRYAPWA